MSDETAFQVNYVHPDADETWQHVEGYRAGLPAAVDAVEYPFMDFELKLVDGTAAGTAYMLFEVVSCIDEDMIGKQICCEVVDYGDDEDVHGLVVYRAELEWSDGFIANTTDETLPYYAYEYTQGVRDSTGTPMGGEVVPELDGMSFWVPESVVTALVEAAR